MCFLLLESLGCPIPRPQNWSIILGMRLQLKVGQAHASYEVYMCLIFFQESMYARVSDQPGTSSSIHTV